MNQSTEQAREIFEETLRQVQVGRVVRGQIKCDGKALRLGTASVAVEDLDQLLIVSVGKAAWEMYQAVRESLMSEEHPEIRAVVITNQGNTGALPGTRVMRGSHPMPDAHSFAAAEAVLSLLREVTSRTAVLFLVSGGASAMMETPLDPHISVADTAAFYQSLIGSGLPIAQINALRKHFSAVKGGRLATARARIQYTMLISDVPAGLPDAIGSGPSLPDSTTLADCRVLLPRLKALPPSVAEFFTGPLCEETPKPDDAAFDRAHWDVVLSSEHLAEAAAQAARDAGFYVEIDNTCDEWEYRDAARYLIERGVALARQHPRCCLISVGEVGVALGEAAGEGGRNQQFALWCAVELERCGIRATILSAGSDGIDGNSQEAGAVCDHETVEHARYLGLDAKVALEAFDATPLLRAVGASLTTGPTGTNLRDLRMILFG